MGSLPISILNLAPRFEGDGAKEALERVVDLAQAAEDIGYARYWIAEHHNFAGVMSSATDLLIQYVLAHTKRIRVGAGGVMMPNHIPLKVAESYGTLATLYPNRVDLGLGRAPGTDRKTMQVLSNGGRHTSSTFPDDVRLLQQYFGPEDKQGEVRAYPAIGLELPLYILGSSFVSARLAAALGLPYVFAAHFSDHPVLDAIEIYRNEFKPSAACAQPYVMVCVNAVVARTQEEADYWYTSTQQIYLHQFFGKGHDRFLAKPKVDLYDGLSSAQKIILEMDHGVAFVGDVDGVRAQWRAFQEKHQVDELMTVAYIHNNDALIESYRCLYEAVCL